MTQKSISLLGRTLLGGFVAVSLGAGLARAQVLGTTQDPTTGTIVQQIYNPLTGTVVQQAYNPLTGTVATASGTGFAYANPLGSGSVYYNPITGATVARSAGINPLTGAPYSSTSAYDPYTGLVGNTTRNVDPYTGTRSNTVGTFNPYTGAAQAQTWSRNPYTGWNNMGTTNYNGGPFASQYGWGYNTRNGAKMYGQGLYNPLTDQGTYGTVTTPSWQYRR